MAPPAHGSVQQFTPLSEADLLARLTAHQTQGHALVGLLSLDQAESVADAAQALGLDEQSLASTVNLYSEFSTEFRQRGPRLVVVSARQLPAMGRAMWEGQHAALISVPPDALDVLASHLKRLVRQKQPDESRLLFRFQDAQVLASLLPVLRERQIAALLGPARSWAVMDECRNLRIASRARSGTATQATGELGLDAAQLQALAIALHPGTVILQANEIDSTLLSGRTKCEQWRLIRERSTRARNLGLKSEEDVALYVVLSLQLPESFDRSGPIVEALARSRAQQTSFGREVDAIDSEQWEAWQQQLEQDGIEL